MATLPLGQMLGERFGSFKAISLLGSGSMGEVFLAQHQRIERRAAIKVLLPERTRDAETVRRLFVEARATSLIRHPGIVEIYDCDVHRNGRAYIVMEYLEGETLGRLLDRIGSLSWPQACRTARRVAAAIGAAHDKGIVHRDLKPENVMLLAAAGGAPPATELKVLDFGLAKLAASVVGGVGTARGSVLGSPAYMSPEQCRGEPVDHRSDVYSLGCVLFEMAAGTPPFSAGRVRELLAAHKTQRPPSLSAVVPHAPGWLAELVAGMLAKKPEERPQSMHEVEVVLAGADLVGPAEPVTAGGAGRRPAAPTQLRA
jgi:eukaryotic-like serine/threonine-protein kinase